MKDIHEWLAEIGIRRPDGGGDPMPPMARVDAFPAVVAGKNFVYFADPIFREYRQAGNVAARDGWKQAMTRLIGPAPFGAALPTTVLCVPRRRGRDLLLTLLHYVPLRKALDIDVIEERMSFVSERLHLPPLRNLSESSARVKRCRATPTVRLPSRWRKGDCCWKFPASLSDDIRNHQRLDHHEAIAGFGGCPVGLQPLCECL